MRTNALLWRQTRRLLPLPFRKRDDSRRLFASSLPRFAATTRNVCDLRSDTVTAPSKEMLATCLKAKTGDDVLGEDPTVLGLQEYVADLFQKESALYLPTGTMANLVALQAHCSYNPGGGGGGGGGSGLLGCEAIIGSNSHISLWEAGGAASLGGIHTRQVTEDPWTAQISLEDIRDAYRDDSDDHCAATRVVCLENTHNMMGGVSLDATYINSVGTLCCQELASSSTSSTVALHVDGARIFHAAVGLDAPVNELCASVDSISVCLSKGLGAPLGSVLVGSKEVVRLAKRARKRCGGGMRQAGVVAAMGLYALQNNVERLVEDHVRAKRLAAELERHGFDLPRGDQVDTNIVYFALPESATVSREEFCQRLARDYGVKVSGGYSRGGRLFRAVTHLDLNDDDINRAADAMVKVAFG